MEPVRALRLGVYSRSSLRRAAPREASLLRRAALSPNVVSLRTTAPTALAASRPSTACRPPRLGWPGSSRPVQPMTRVVVAGASPRTRMPTQASGVSTTMGRPASTPRTMRLAARSASMDSERHRGGRGEPRVLRLGVAGEARPLVRAGPHQAGHDGGRRHTGAAQGRGEPVGEADRAELRGRVGQQVRRRDHAADRGDRADAPASPAPHPRQHGERGMDRPAGHRVDRVVDTSRAVIASAGPTSMMPATLMSDVDRDRCRLDLLDEGVDRRPVADVADAGVHLTAPVPPAGALRPRAPRSPRAVMTTSWPRSSSSRAMSRPSPREAPMTSASPLAVRSQCCMSFSSLSGAVSSRASRGSQWSCEHSPGTASRTSV